MESPFTDFSFPSVGTRNEVNNGNEEVNLQSPFLNLENNAGNEKEWQDEEMVDEEEMEFEDERSIDIGETNIESEAMSVPAGNPIAFASAPGGSSYWPIITVEKEGRMVSYQRDDGVMVGNSARRFLADRKTSDGSPRYHVGIDLYAKFNEPVIACEDGIILAFKHFYTTGGGNATNSLIVQHPEVIVNYGEVGTSSLSRTNLRVGDRVKAGQTIGFIGATNMLHFETYSIDGSSAQPPFRWMKSERNPPPRLLNPTKYLLFLSTNGLGASPGIAIASSSSVPASLSTAPSSFWEKAIRLNNYYSQSLGWNQHHEKINDLLLPFSGQQNVSLNEEDFAYSVSGWQRQQGFSIKDADGIIGPATWKKMQTILGLNSPAISPSTPSKSSDSIVARILRHTTVIEQYSSSYKINPNTIRGIIAAESGGNPRSGEGGSGYKGLMQAETTADQLDPATSIRTGIKKFIDFRDKTLNPWLTKLGISTPPGNDENYLKACLSCYNAGPVTALKAIQYAHAAGDWHQWLLPEHYQRALVFSGGYAQYPACNKGKTTTEITKARNERIKYRFKTSGWRSEPDPLLWNNLLPVLNPIMRCWIETKFKNSPGYLDRFIQYFKYFENNPVAHEMEDTVVQEEGDKFFPGKLYEQERAGEYEMTNDEETESEEMEWEDEEADMEEENFNELVMRGTEDTEEEMDEEHDEYEDTEDIVSEEEFSYQETGEENETVTDHEEWEEDWLEVSRTEQEPVSMQNEFEIPGSAGSSVSTAIFKNWYDSVASLKNKFPNEPQNNIDQLPIPAWINADSFYEEFIEKHSDDARTIIGDASEKVLAQYFVLHDTAVAADFTQSRVKGKGIHLWVNAKSPVLLGNDWHVKGLGVKLERRKNNSFVHVEITRDKELQKAVQQKTKGKKISYEEIIKAGGIKNFGTYYTDKQYELVAYAYLVASIRKGKFLTVTIHREVDRGVVVKRLNGQYGYGHDDPQFFDLNCFYSIVCRLLKMPVKVSFGIQSERALVHKQGNMPGYINSFIPFVAGDAGAANQYGELMRLNPQTTKYKVSKLKYGYYYDVTHLKNKLLQTEVDDEILFETSRSLSPGSGTGASVISVPAFIAEDLTVPGYTCYARIDLGKANYPLNMTGIYIPQVFDPKKPVDVLLYLHGMTGAFPGACAQIIDYWSTTDLPKYDLRLREEINASGGNVILVAPSLGDSPNKYPNYLSGKKGGLDNYLEKVLIAVNAYIIKKRFNSDPINFGNIILAAHSVGGLQMLKIAASDNPIYGPKILECWGFDSLYGRVADAWLSWAKKNKEKKLVLYYQSSTEGNARLLEHKSKNLLNIFIKRSPAKSHYWVPKEHLKERVIKISRTGLTKMNFEDSNASGHENFVNDQGE